MKMMHRFFSSALVLVMITAATLLGSVAHAAYPEKTIRMVIPFPPGGSTDTLARVLGDFMSRDMGQPVIIDNRSGAGTLLGSDVVAKSDADGYTILLTISSLVQSPHLLSKPPFDPVKDFVPIAQLVTTPLALAVRAESGLKTPADLVERLKAEPGRHAFGSYGAGSSGHLYVHAFNDQTDTEWAHIPYRGEASMITDLLGGQVTAIIITGVSALPYVKSERMNVLALTGPVRMPAMPDVPTFTDLGYERLATRGWFGMFGPAGMDSAIVARLSDSLMKALNDPDVVQRIENLSLIVDPLPADEFLPVVHRDNDLWRGIIKEVGVQLD